MKNKLHDISEKKIKGDRIGIFFGTVSPLHQGHYSEIVRAKRENDGCVVIVSGYTGDRGENAGMNLTQRGRSTREIFSEDDNVSVSYVNEDHIPAMPHGWEPWLDLVLTEVKKLTVNPNAKYVWYTGEKEYQEKLNELRPQDEVVLVDRQILPISGTAIRENPLKHWNYILPPFRKYFSKNYLVIGSPSTGKTSLIRDLGRRFNAPFTYEAARTYEPLFNVRDNELLVQDLLGMGLAQFELNRSAIREMGNPGLVFFDTDISTTEVYTQMYAAADYESVRQTFEIHAKRQKFEKIFVIPPITEYVDDGFRDMTTANDDERWEMHNAFMAIIKKYGWEDKVVLLDEPSYMGRYNQACDVVCSMLDSHK
ncbi:AAA family ATPase [Vagococcus coleopterorum]|uniref:AAA family ATPase n=1 Tax=Vagococcus coleopterorum TaxID=2714946 RepID=A0A6G8AMK9_9ENTE|nr:AAA family ATPase [Vagococcus coleopterorum]QIL46236.1 AAA family ATPase [Vagococcus coleopterorum]